MSYQNHYGIQLLDDIHNYFPAVLYEPHRFRSVADLLHYIRVQTQSRFDLFSAGQAAHTERSQIARQAPHANTHTRSTMRPRVDTVIAPITQTILIDESQDHIQGIASQLLREMLLAPTYSAHGVAQGAAQNPFLNPVVVRPTPEQIAAATTVETVVAEGEMCAICQDTIATGAEARSINACDHSFHTGCIDTWFTTNVRCPVCRHDIREEE
jgi:hypothetical protein